jgi:hypothetical protein
MNEHSLGRAERIKAGRNLDFTSEKCNSSKSHASFIHYSNENVIDNLQVEGISIRNNSDQITSLVKRIQEVELERLIDASRKDIVSDVFDRGKRGNGK